MTAAEKFQNLLKDSDRYDAEAYSFVYEALDFTLKNVLNSGKSRRGGGHVTGPELLEGVRRYSIDQFGCLAQSVLESWGIEQTDDFGQIVFNLVQHDLMGKQDSDRPEDFRGVYNFSDVFDVTPVFHYSKDQDEWRARYVPRSQLSRLDS